jgi:hypothetical protein
MLSMIVFNRLLQQSGVQSWHAEHVTASQALNKQTAIPKQIMQHIMSFPQKGLHVTALLLSWELWLTDKAKHTTQSTLSSIAPLALVQHYTPAMRGKAA